MIILINEIIFACLLFILETVRWQSVLGVKQVSFNYLYHKPSFLVLIMRRKKENYMFLICYPYKRNSEELSSLQVRNTCLAGGINSFNSSICPQRFVLLVVTT